MIRNYSKHGTFSIGSDGGINYHRGTQDGHGGRGEEHRQEMQSIAEQAIAQQVPQMAAEIYNEAIQRLIGAMEYDIETTVSVSLDDAGEIFRGSKYRKLISDRIVQELRSKLKDVDLRL